MSSTAIPNPEPLVIPPHDGKVYNDIWILDMRVRAPSSTSGVVSFTYCPYDSSTGEILEHKKTRVFLNLWEVVETIPQAAFAMQAIFESVPHILAWQKGEPVSSETPSVSGGEGEGDPEDPPVGDPEE